MFPSDAKTVRRFAASDVSLRLKTVADQAATSSITVSLVPLRIRRSTLREAKEKSTSEYVVANKEGGPLTYTEFRSLWRFIVVRTAKPRKAKKKVGGKYVKYMLYPQLGETARNNGKVQYVLDFEVTPHQLRHTYITNLIAAGVDPKTVQYLAGHEKSKITMDIYAKVKYNKPEELAKALTVAFDQWKKPTDIKQKDQDGE